MNPRSLLETGSFVERALLAAGASEEPDAESIARAERGLGIVPKAIGIAVVIAAIKAIRWWHLAAWGAAPVAVGAAVLAYAAIDRPGVRAAHPAAPVTVEAHDKVADAPPSVASPAVASPPMVIASGATAPTAPDRRNAGAVADSSRPSIRRVSGRAEVGDALGEQAAAIDRARSLLAANDPKGAIGALDAYARRFQGGPFAEEAAVLRVEALARSGNSAAAESLGRDFLKQYPGSVHARRVTAALDSRVSP